MKKLTIKECKKWIKKYCLYLGLKYVNSVKLSNEYGIYVSVMLKTSTNDYYFYIFTQSENDIRYTVKSLYGTVYTDKKLMYENNNEREKFLNEK